MPSYKSYCWALGTTSFRMVEFNRKIERQLHLLNEFRNDERYKEQRWSENKPLQIAYYEHLKDNGFIEGDAPRKEKDAREKTCGLVDLGLIDSERRLTEVGNALHDLSLSGSFESDNILQIPADSYIYLRQLLKVCYAFDDKFVRPYAILAIALEQFGEISKDEFTYLLPLITSENKVHIIFEKIEDIRNDAATIDDVIIDTLLSMDNYQEAYHMLLENQVDEQLITEIGFNRKSRSYDRPYYTLYKALEAFSQSRSDEDAIALFDAVIRISGKSRTYWKKLIFNTPRKSNVYCRGADTINESVSIFNCTNEHEFKFEFFKLLHLYKAKSLLSDYYDLNRRYFKTSGTILFQDGMVRLDIIPNCYFFATKEELLDIAFKDSDLLNDNCELSDIIGADILHERLFEIAEEKYGVQVRNIHDIQTFVEDKRYERFNQMVDRKFTDENILTLLSLFENRFDNDIQAMVTNNADVPTMFEYVLAVLWYKISGRQGKVLDYMNLSLDADLLPITHAAGGHEDITYRYEATDNYPAHTLLIEATLASGTNQRRMEMEPVSRHLGGYLLSNPDEIAYCIFATTHLHINVIADFRGRRYMSYYSSDGSKSVNGMKIIPCATRELATILQNHITYDHLYGFFEEAYVTNAPANTWYEQEIVGKL